MKTTQRWHQILKQPTCYDSDVDLSEGHSGARAVTQLTERSLSLCETELCHALQLRDVRRLALSAVHVVNASATMTQKHGCPALQLL